MFRFFCLQVQWNSNVDFSHDRMVDASKLIEKFKHFFINMNQVINAIENKNKLSKLPEKVFTL
jgi:cysteinyl-tRNA synthetase